MNHLTVNQLVLAHLDAIEHGVKRITGPARLGADVTADLVADAQLALLDGRGAKFDASRGNPKTFCRMVGYQVALDKLRAMNRGGQFSGAYAGFGNSQLNADRGDDGAQQHPDTPAITPTVAEDLAHAQWLANARKAVASVLPGLSDSERMLWDDLQAGTFNAAEYASRHGIATATAHVRANRLRAKVRKMLKVAA